MDNTKSKVYVLTDERGRILRCEGGYTVQNIPNMEDWIFLDEGYGDKFNLCQSHYFEGGLHTRDGMIPLYKYEDGKAVKRTEEEMESDRAALPVPEGNPTKLDIIEAQVTYTAMMTDTLLEV